MCEMCSQLTINKSFYKLIQNFRMVNAAKMNKNINKLWNYKFG